MIALQRKLRMGLRAMVDLLGFSMARLKAASPDDEVAQALEALANAKPEPLRAVADLVDRTVSRLREGLLKDAETLTKRHLAAKKSLAEMPQKYEEAITELNALRLHVAGTLPLNRYAGVLSWETAYPIEQRLLKAADANDAQAQAAKARMANMLEAAITHLQQRLAQYETQHGQLPAAHALLNAYAKDLDALEWTLLEMEEAREQLVQEAPLVLAPDVEDLSLARQFPAEAQAQAVAEAAIAAAKQEAKVLARETRKEARVLEKHHLQKEYTACLAQVQAGKQPQPNRLSAHVLHVPPVASPAAPETHPAPALPEAVETTATAAQSTSPQIKEVQEVQEVQEVKEVEEVKEVQEVNEAQEVQEVHKKPEKEAQAEATPSPKPAENVAAGHQAEGHIEANSAYDIPLVALPKGLDLNTLTYAYRPKGWVAEDETMYQEYKRTMLNGQNPPLELLPELTIDLMKQRRQAEKEEQASKKRLNKGVKLSALATINKIRR